MNWSIEKLDNWNIKLKCPSYESREFRYKSKKLEYNVYLGRYSYKNIDDYLYKEQESDGFIFGVGFSSYLLYNYYDKFDQDSIDILNEFDPIKIPLDNLYEFQQTDLDTLLQFKRGLFQVFTGYGKTEVIASLIDYLTKHTTLNVLVLTPSANALKTIKERLYNKYDINTSYFDYSSNLNVINVNGFPSSNYMDENNEYWSKVDIILSDEVEYTSNDTGLWLCSLCTNASRIYGFSATADKTTAEKIRLTEGNIEVVQRNKWLINYYGFASVYKLPDNFIIHEFNINTTLFQNIPADLDKSSELNEIVYSIFTDERFCDGLFKIVKRDRAIFVPMFRLQVIDHWIDNYFRQKQVTAVVICSRGYELYSEGEYVRNISTQELNDLIENDIIDFITGTKSSFSAIDMPKLKKAMILHSSLAGIVIQAIGRVTRGSEFYLYNLIPYRDVPVYSRDLKKRNKLLNEYYVNCRFLTTNKLETDYGIY